MVTGTTLHGPCEAPRGARWLQQARHNGAMNAPSKEQSVPYLRASRDAMVWKLDGVSEYDARRPFPPTGTNLLGLIKHLASVGWGI